MRKLAPLIFVVAAVWAWDKFRQRAVPVEADAPVASASLDSNETGRSDSFSCDGRQYCSQMRSCAEATYFLEHCPNVKMDGDHDGVPCEQQWCGSR
ncbi:MAG: excalibur calcium-binding domain-containing protein [Gammaproteobacteria bacterium]|nr:excalibur calcium-binding domain-containing protein [Gammaproteobacteria bacterium]